VLGWAESLPAHGFHDPCIYVYIHHLLPTHKHTTTTTVATTTAASTVSKARKAKAALVRPDLQSPADPLGELQRRVFAFVNEYGGGGYENFRLEVGGQEPFNVIMYNTTGDEYRCVWWRGKGDKGGLGPFGQLT
jgi:hypothetical protein